MRLILIIFGFGTLVCCSGVAGHFEIGTLTGKLLRHWWGAGLLYSGLLTGPGLALGALWRHDVMVRLFSILTSTLWFGLGCAITQFLHGFAFGAVACFLIFAVLWVPAIGHASDDWGRSHGV